MNLPKWLRFFFCWLLLFSSTTLIGQSNQGTETDTIKLVQALRILEEAFDVYFLYEADILQKYEVAFPSNKLDEPVEKILKNILHTTDLIYIKLSQKSYAIRKKNTQGWIFGKIVDERKRPLPGATIYMPDTQKGLVTGIDGRYHFELEPGRWKLISSYVGKENKEVELDINAGDSIQFDFKLDNTPFLQEVVVAGPRTSNHSLLEIASPVSVLNMEQFENKSTYGLSELLHINIPSFHSTNQTIADGTDHIDPATLKGLGPDQMLVLINGKRRHQSALVNINGTIGKGSVATDLNAIPIVAIEKIEVLRDGASVHYGSDAIAGVINIVLKENDNFSDVFVRTGISNEGDGFTANVAVNSGFKLTKKGGFLNLSLNYLNRNALNRSGDYTGIIFGNERDNDPEEVEAFFEQTGYKNRRVMSVGSASIDNASMFINAKIPINKNLELYGFGGGSFRFGNAGGFYRFPYQVTRQSGLYEYGFSPRLKTNIGDQSLTIGIKQQRGGWQYDLSNTTGKNDIVFNVQNSNNASLGISSPSSAKAGGFNYLQNTTNLDLNKTFQTKMPIDIGFGSEFRVENFKQTSGEEASWKDYNPTGTTEFLKEPGIQMFLGFTPDNAVEKTRYNVGIYSNVETALFKHFKLGMASRYEYYNDFGSNISWKTYARIKLSKKSVLKGSINTGFRAPSMPQTYFNNLSYQFISSTQGQEGVAVGSFNNESLVTRQFGIPLLKAETSTNYNIGFATSLLNNLSITLDAYLIDIKNRIVITGRFSAEDSPEFAEILVPLNLGYAQFFSNAIDTRTRGVDLELHYVIPIKSMQLKFDLLGNISKTSILKDENGDRKIHTSELLSGFEQILFNREEVGRIESAQPGSKIIFNTSFIYEKISASMTFTRFGTVKYIHPSDGNSANWVINEFSGRTESRDQTFSSKWLTDLTFEYRFSNRFSMSAGGSNIFNIYPDKHQHSNNTSNGVFTYSRRINQFGVRGAYWYASASFRL